MRNHAKHEEIGADGHYATTISAEIPSYAPAAGACQFEKHHHGAYSVS